MLLNTDAHCLDDEVVADMAKQGVEIEDRQHEPWDILFRGTEAALRTVLAAHWGISQLEIDQTIEMAIDTDVDVRKATPAVIDQASAADDIDDAFQVVQKAIGVTTGDNASMYATGAIMDGWKSATTAQRTQWLRGYVDYERAQHYPVPFNQ